MQAGERQADPKCRNRRVTGAHELALADVDGHGRVAQGRRIKDGPLVPGARRQTTVRQPSRQIEGEHRRLGELPLFGARAGRRDDVEHEHAAVHAAPHLDRAGTGIEREGERPQGKSIVHARRRAELGQGGRAEQRHLKLAVLLQLEPVRPPGPSG